MGSEKYNSLLWELSTGKDVESSYLFGTIHLPEADLQFRISEVKEYILTCEVFMAEYPLDQQDEAAARAFQLEQGIDQLIPEKKYIKLRTQLKKSFGLDIAMYNRLKPMILEQLLAETLVSHHTGLPMDVALWNYAKQNEKELRGAETLSSQLEILQRFPLELQLRNLQNIGKNPSKYRKQVANLSRYYRDENLVKLYKASIKSLANMKDVLVYTRNRKITDAILDTLQTNTLFCAVGAGHLYGEKGLLRLLKHRGVRTKAIYPLSQ